MNKLKGLEDSTAIKWVTWISTITLLSLLALFLIVMLYSTDKLTSQIKLSTEHPFTVNGNISDVKTDLALIRIRTERLQTYNQPQDVEEAALALEDLYVDMEALIDNIDKLYLGPDEDIEALRKSYGRMQDAHERLLQFAKLPSSTTDVIAEYEKRRLYPIYDTFEKDAQRILTFVRDNQQNIFITAEQLSKSAMAWSLVIIAAMALGLLLFQYAIRKMSRRLYDKNNQFAMLSNTIDEIFLIYEKDRKRCDFVSGSAERVLGLPAGLLTEDRKLVYKYMDDKTAAKIRAELYFGKKTSWETDVEYRHPQSIEPRWLRLRFYRIAENNQMKYIITMTDRTKERRSEQALRDALVGAQNANNAKRDFLSRMSHEIRTPMNAIIGMTTIAAASMDDRRRMEDCLEKIGYSSKHLLTLINDVLDMSRIESNSMKLDKEPFDLYQFLSTFVSVVYPQARDKGLQFVEKTTGFSEHTTYLGDSFRLNQILLNLTSNAIKFTPREGEVSLEVAHMPSRDKKHWLRFVVSDTGIGMDEDALKRLYIPFEQADAAIARKYGGTGLGMSITQNLVALMGGYIDVKSIPGKGTTVTVDLPFEKSNIELQPIQAESLELLTVLVADDEQDICEHTALLLEKMKIRAEWALGGAEAVERVVAALENGRGFDVCFIDWKMPNMDGVETTRRIREKVGENTPIIIISAYDWSEIEEEAREAGANAFIAKPLFQSSIYNALIGIANGAFGMSDAAKNVKGDSLHGKRLLLAEDNALNMEIAVSLLEMNGAAVECAENGQEAADLFLRSKPGYFDAILMDVQMPVMNGYEATKKIRSCDRFDARKIPIIATTANAFTEDVASVLAAGMNAHVSKPIDIQLLCSVLLDQFSRGEADAAEIAADNQ